LFENTKQSIHIIRHYAQRSKALYPRAANQALPRISRVVQTESAASEASNGLTKYRRPLLIGGPIIVALIALFFHLTGGRYVSTDDAYVQAARVDCDFLKALLKAVLYKVHTVLTDNGIRDCPKFCVGPALINSRRTSLRRG
jgi:hypothetical protein